MPPSKGLGGDEVQLGGDRWVPAPPPPERCILPQALTVLQSVAAGLFSRKKGRSWCAEWPGHGGGGETPGEGGGFAGDAPPQPL